MNRLTLIWQVFIDYLISIYKALIWCTLSLLFGLLQLWIVLGYSYFDDRNILDSDKLFKECGLIFFSTSLVSGLAIDFFLKKKHNLKSFGWIGFLYGLYPLIIIVISVIIYSVCFWGHPDIEILINWEFIIIMMSIIYAFVLKAFKIFQ